MRINGSLLADGSFESGGYNDSCTSVYSDVTVDCDNIPDVPALPDATDNCDDDVEVEFEEESTGWDNCEYNIFRTWTATDNCGNSTSYTQTITVQDNYAPVLSSMPGDLTLTCNDSIPPPQTLTATDMCDGTVDVYLTVASSTSCPGQMEMTRTWTASDACGNTTTHTQTINVVDNDGPVINHNLDLEITVECDAIPAPETLTAYDECSTATVASSDVSFVGPCDASYTINRIYVAFDECGNTSSVTQIINVVDTTPPSFDTLPQSGEIDCPEQGGGEPDAISATDNCDEEVEVWYEDSYGSCSITRTWHAQDDCGNTSTATQVLTFNDTTPPTFDNVPEDVTVECDNIPNVGEVSASDNCSAAFVTVNDKILPGSCPGNYTILRTYIALDACGNTATESQTITVEDTTPPSLPAPPSDATVSCDAIPPANGLNGVTDNCDPDPEVYFEEESFSEGDCQTTIIRTWTATDDCGNSDSVSQVLTVVDNEAPEFVYDENDPQV